MPLTIGTLTTKQILDGLATIGLTREETYHLISVLYERAAMEPLDLTNGAWYCENCGSTDVDLISWVKANENLRDAGSESPDDDTYCTDCGKHETAIHHCADDGPLFCECVTDGEFVEDVVPKASWRELIPENAKDCPDCGKPYTATRPEKPPIEINTPAPRAE